jgi:hypothetical protein
VKVRADTSTGTFGTSSPVDQRAEHIENQRLDVTRRDRGGRMTVAGWDESARQRAGREQRDTTKENSSLTVHFLFLVVGQ